MKPEDYLFLVVVLLVPLSVLATHGLHRVLSS